MLRRILVSLVLGLTLASLTSAAAFQDDLQGRRTRIMQLLGSDSMLILWSAPERVYSGDVNYPYRQDSNFYYLTGISSPNPFWWCCLATKTGKRFSSSGRAMRFANTGRGIA